ncbi:iron-containing alcohol dehydrogenase [Vibrio lentus]|uniref:iron-containing alcohol dehydrogenase n=1 Tax=Vibrio lentus TaxID=136468 RepID=UPI00097820B0|nr:iron-containing alcohol dehydrogenase [Vibrio lentus]OMO20412.1 alcohol dehydrogenase [Vibrio lentus]PMN11170.1 alcohol dehydrogenase [Vibrio lentus]
MFQFMTPTKIIFGDGALQASLSLFNQYGYSVLLVTGNTLERTSLVTDYLDAQNMRYQHIAVSGEPNIKMVEEAATSARRFKPDMVVAMGGGSAIDMGKALAAVLPNQGNLYDYVEVVGRNVPLKAKPLPFIAIPTTASTGAEVTKNAVLKSGQDQVKISLRSPDMLADVAIVDPTLTYGTNLYLSGRGAMDAFTHLMEAYVCGEPNSLTDMICEEGLRKLSGSVVKACVYDEPQARSDLAFASMLGGIAITNAKLGAAHGLASALGGKISAPHSVITARLAPFVMMENIAVAREQQRSDILARYQRIAQIVTGSSEAKEEDAISWLSEVLDTLKLPSLLEFGVCEAQFNEVSSDALKSVAIKGNPLPLNQQRLVHILQQVCAECVCGGEHHETVSMNQANQRTPEQVAESSFTIINSYASENNVVEKGNSWTI